MSEWPMSRPLDVPGYSMRKYTTMPRRIRKQGNDVNLWDPFLIPSCFVRRLQFTQETLKAGVVVLSVREVADVAHAADVGGPAVSDHRQAMHKDDRRWIGRTGETLPMPCFGGESFVAGTRQRAERNAAAQLGFSECACQPSRPDHIRSVQLPSSGQKCSVVLSSQ